MSYFVVTETGTLEEVTEGSLIPGSLYAVSVAAGARIDLERPIEIRIRLCITDDNNFGLFKSHIKTWPRFAA